MTATLEDLRTALREEAEAVSAPSPLELIDGAAAARGSQRSARRRTWLAAAAVVAIGAAAVAATQPFRHDGPPAPAAPSIVGLRLEDGQPPQYAQGLHLVGTTRWNLPRLTGGLPSPAVESNRPLYAVAWCPAPVADSPALEPMSVAIDRPGVGTTVPCTDAGSGASADDIVALPAPEGAGGVELGLGGDVPVSGEIVVALYEEARWAQYPFASTSALPDAPVVEPDAQLLDGASPMTPDPELSATLGMDVRSASMLVAPQPGASLRLWTGEPGELMVAVNGTVLTNDGEGLTFLNPAPGPAGQADPALRAGRWTTFGPAERVIDLSPEGLTSRGVTLTGGPVRVSVTPRSFARSGWQVVAVGTAPAGPATPYADSSVFPEYVEGTRLVGAFTLPADGAEHGLDLGGKDPGGLFWVAICDSSAVDPEWPSGVTVTGGDGATRQVRCRPQEARWTEVSGPADQQERQPTSGATGAGDAAASVTARSDSVSLDGSPFVVAAYEEVPWQDYPSDKGVEIEPGIVSGGLEAWFENYPVRLERTAELTSADLDADGSATVQVPSAGNLAVEIRTSHHGRVRLLLDGQVWTGTAPTGFEAPRGGWFGSWTDEGDTIIVAPMDHALGTGPDEPATLTIETEGYSDGGLEIDVRELRVDP